MRLVYVGYGDGGALVDVEQAVQLRDALDRLGFDGAADVIACALQTGRAALDDGTATDVVDAIDAITSDRRLVQGLRGLRTAIGQEARVRQQTGDGPILRVAS